jgi:hypothetical protein
MPKRIRTEDVWPDKEEDGATTEIENRLRRSASFWRGLAMVVMILGGIGSIVIAVAAGQGPYGEGFDTGSFVTVLFAALLGLLLSMGFFFMGGLLMEGLAELLDRTPSSHGRTRRSAAAPAWQPPSGRASQEGEPSPSHRPQPPPEEERLAPPLRAEVERMRQVGFARGYLVEVTAVSATEALVETGFGRFRVTVGEDGQAKVEGA